jgi:flagellar hook assembly protein FlgD
VLKQNYPNPFRSSTNISFSIPAKSYVSLKIYDRLGREVATVFSGETAAGQYTREWDAANIPGGIYYYRLQAGSSSETKKLILLR